MVLYKHLLYLRTLSVISLKTRKAARLIFWEQTYFFMNLPSEKKN